MHPAVSSPSPVGHYLDWGVIHISITNLVIILVMLLVFALAIVLPFPRAEDLQPAPARRDDRPDGTAS